MNSSSSDLAGILGRCQAGIAAILRSMSARAEQTKGLADLLRELTPRAALTACLLHSEESDAFATSSLPGSEASDAEDALRRQLASCDPLALGVQRVPNSPPPGLSLLVSAIHENLHSLGFLILGLPENAAPEEVAQAEALLSVAAVTTALRYTLEALQSEQKELARFALVGQAFAGLAHDLNNALNSMMLQTSVVQLKVDEQSRNDLTAIRQHGAQAAGLVRSLQHVVQERRDKFYPVNLNSVLTEVVEEGADLSGRVALQLSPDRLHISSTRSAVKQLVRLLVEGACTATKATVQVGTQKRDDAATLSLTIAEPTLDESAEGEPPAVESLLWQHLDEVGLQAGRSLLRQLGGELTMNRTNDGGLVFRVNWEKTT
jgi:signal transduction histidine kinase